MCRERTAQILRALSCAREWVVCPETTPKVLQVPEQPAMGSGSQDSTVSAGPSLISGRQGTVGPEETAQFLQVLEQRQALGIGS